MTYISKTDFYKPQVQIILIWFYNKHYIKHFRCYHLSRFWQNNLSLFQHLKRNAHITSLNQRFCFMLIYFNNRCFGVAPGSDEVKPAYERGFPMQADHWDTFISITHCQPLGRAGAKIQTFRVGNTLPKDWLVKDLQPELSKVYLGPLKHLALFSPKERRET